MSGGRGRLVVSGGGGWRMSGGKWRLVVVSGGGRWAAVPPMANSLKKIYKNSKPIDTQR